VGAPELAARAAERTVGADPARTAVVLRCLLPRTFIDCNRIVDAGSRPTATKAGELTPGISPWVKDPFDRALVLGRYATYRALVEQAFQEVVGGGGHGVMVHTYAPLSVEVPVDEKIVQSLKAAYSPEQVKKWPRRAQVDLISRTREGELLSSEALVEAARSEFVAAGLKVAENNAYHLHDATMAYQLARRYPGKTLCFEVRRDLLVAAFTPFVEMQVDPVRIDRAAVALARALSKAKPA
jgi:hypothetical protein